MSPIDKILKKITRIEECEVFQNISLKKYNTLKLDVYGNLVKTRSEDSLVNIVKLLKDQKINYHIIGAGSNTVLTEKKDRIFLMLDFDYKNYIPQAEKAIYLIPASMPLYLLTQQALKLGIKGWNVFTGIPASLGGAIWMNAGTRQGEIKEVVSRVKVLKNNLSIEWIDIDKNSFSYRKNHILDQGEIVLWAELKHLGFDKDNHEVNKIKQYYKKRKDTQPLDMPNCGCVFKNPNKDLSAGLIIDQLGLKGLTVGDLRVSSKHGNFIVNTGKANSDDFNHLVKLIQSTVKNHLGVLLEVEVEIN